MVHFTTHAPLLALLAFALLAPATPACAQEAPPHPKHHRLAELARKGDVCVLVLDLAGTPGYAMAAQARRAERQVAAGGVDILLAQIDLEGAWGQSAEAISQALLAASGHATVVAYVKGKAADAGAMVALSAQFVAMAKGAYIGSKSAGNEPTASDVAYLSNLFARLAAEQGHPVGLCRAIVDPKIRLHKVLVDGRTRVLSEEELVALERQGTRVTNDELVSLPGERYSPTAKVAFEHGLAVASVDSLDGLWAAWKLKVTRTEEVATQWSDPVVDFASRTWVLVLLLALGAFGIYMELITPGFGIWGTVGLACLAVALAVQYANGAAEAAEIALLVFGLALLAVEILFIPGFGWVGLAGFFCTGVGLLLCLQSFIVPEHSWQHDQLGRSALVVTGGMCAALLGIATLFRLMPNLPMMRRVALTNAQSAADGYVAAAPSLAALVGRSGLAATPLRPAGKLSLDGALHDVVCEGEFIEAGEAIAVRAVEGHRVVVERLVRPT